MDIKLGIKCDNNREIINGEMFTFCKKTSEMNGKSYRRSEYEQIDRVPVTKGIIFLRMIYIKLMAFKQVDYYQRRKLNNNHMAHFLPLFQSIL